MKIEVVDYPCNFEFRTKAKFTEFYERCDKRTSMLHKKMKQLNIDSPYHEYTDYVVEIVYKTPGGEVWRLGS